EQVVVLNASGYVTPRRKSTVAAKITGRVKEIFVDEGSEVKEGQLLALLDESDAKATLSRAVSAKEIVEASLKGTKAKLEESERNLKRGEELFNSGFLDEQSFDRLKSDYTYLKGQYESQLKSIEEAKASIKVAERDLVNCKVVAPFNGIVISKDAQPGEMVSPFSAGGGFTRTGIVTIVDMDSLEIEVDVSESNLSKVYSGQKVFAVLDAYPDIKFPGKVRTVIPSADRQKATVKVRISFDELSPKILPDMGVRVSFLKEGNAFAGLFIPKSSIIEEENKCFVFIFDKNKLEKRVVETGEEANSEVQIVSGLKEGELVVSNPSLNLKNGSRANAIN
ncbi:MAG: efflux RND transporter periplasmic adaptor subunit, partial [Acidobacteria bacterium]|nr:efflux RND transporter periplasmic adaptor subunit [Acidobacteriota bacterium]